MNGNACPAESVTAEWKVLTLLACLADPSFASALGGFAPLLIKARHVRDTSETRPRHLMNEELTDR